MVHLVAGELNQGAARGARALHTALRHQGVDSALLSNSRQRVQDAAVETTIPVDRPSAWAIDLLRRQADRLLVYPYRGRGDVVFSAGAVGINLLRHRLVQEADVVHLHWINAGLVDIAQLRDLGRPVVWTLRDMWPMTGGCHYSLGCTRFYDACGACPQLGSRRQRDLSRWIFSRKVKHYPSSMTVVGISEWLAGLARESALLRGHDVRVIPNGIDTEAFRPVDRAIARQILGIVPGRFVLLVGASDLASPYKGQEKLIEMLRLLDPTSFQVLVFGRSAPAALQLPGLEVRVLGFLHDDVALRLAYSAADVFVATSTMEAFGKTLAEALACGTPVVCFDAAGPREIVEHRCSGYRARIDDPRDLADGVQWVVAHDDPASLAIAARRRAVEHFDVRLSAERYRALYAELLGLTAEQVSR